MVKLYLTKQGLSFNLQHIWITPSQQPVCRKQNGLVAGVTRTVHLLSADLLQGLGALGNPSHWVSKAKSSKKVNPLGDNKLLVPT